MINIIQLNKVIPLHTTRTGLRICIFTSLTANMALIAGTFEQLRINIPNCVIRIAFVVVIVIAISQEIFVGTLRTHFVA